MPFLLYNYASGPPVQGGGLQALLPSALSKKALWLGTVCLSARFITTTVDWKKKNTMSIDIIAKHGLSLSVVEVYNLCTSAIKIMQRSWRWQGFSLSQFTWYRCANTIVHSEWVSVSCKLAQMLPLYISATVATTANSHKCGCCGSSHPD